MGYRFTITHNGYPPLFGFCELDVYLKNVLCSIFSNETQKMGREIKKLLKIDPGSVSGACLWPLIDKKVFQQLVINLK